MAQLHEPPAMTAHAAPDGVTVSGSGFPGPAVTGLCMILAPVLGIAGSALAANVYNAKGATFVQGMVAHHAQTELGLNLAVTGIAFLILAVGALARAAAVRRPKLGRTGGVLTILGLCGPLFFEGIYWGGLHLTGTAAHRVAAASMIDTSQVIPGVIVNVSGPALVIGFIVLAVGTAKAGVLSRPASAALGATCLIPFGFISGYIVISAVGFLGAAIALVPLGIRILAQRRALA